MDDRFLEEQRRAPRPEFARGLKDRLGALGPADDLPRPRRLRRALAAGLAVAAAASAFTVPAVRVAAQQVLDLFRVRDIAVVQVDAARIQELKDRHLDPAAIFGGHTETLVDGGPRQRFTDLGAAAAAAGFTPERPGVLPASLAPDSVFVTGAATSRVTVDVKQLRALLDAADVRDVEIPPGLDAGPIEVRRPAVLVQTFRGVRGARVALVQAPSPEVSLPPGLDLARLGEIGLRVLGLAPADARRIAGSIDWRSTLVVPVIASATRFERVDVNGAHGLLLETTGDEAQDGRRHRPGHALLWTSGGRVYAVVGDLGQVDLVQMAQSVR